MILLFLQCSTFPDLAVPCRVTGCCGLISHLIAGRHPLVSPAAASLLGPSWLAGGGLWGSVSVRGRRVATFPAAVRGSGVRVCSGSVLGPLLLTEEESQTYKLNHSKTLYTVFPFSILTLRIKPREQIDLLVHVPRVILALPFVFVSLFISFIITEFQLGGVINLLIRPCSDRKQLQRRFCTQRSLSVHHSDQFDSLPLFLPQVFLAT